MEDMEESQVSKTRRGWTGTVELKATVGAVAAQDTSCAGSRWLGL